jgi:hypothetical protein
VSTAEKRKYRRIDTSEQTAILVPHADGRGTRPRKGTAMSADPVAELLSDPRFAGKPITWGVTSESYDAIRRAWLTHVQAEEVLFQPFTEGAFQRQIEIMLSVFTDDCVMELASAGMRWQGRAQATEFYRLFLGAFEAMQWVPQALVIGPQGVLDVVNMTGTLRKKFAGLTQVGAQVHLQWVIYFPWVPEQGKFKGEVIYSIRPL